MSRARMSRARAVAQLIASLIALAGLIALLVFFLCGTYEATTRKDVPDVPLVESPLDAIAYESPKFADGAVSYKVCDRGTGRTWWLIHMNGGWAVLPIGELE